MTKAGSTAVNNVNTVKVWEELTMPGLHPCQVLREDP
jgi:hypothetical protein